MNELYTLRSPSTITKFDPDGNPIASYLTTTFTCDCPAGQRPTCRHRQMLAQLEPIRDTEWFLSWDREVKVGLIVDINGTPKHIVDRLTLNETVPKGPQIEPAPAPQYEGVPYHEVDDLSAASSNGKTADFESVNVGSIPTAAAKPAPPQPFRRRI